MIDPQILDYVNQQITAGISVEEIRKSLLSSGWQEGDINDALSRANSFSVTTNPTRANRELNRKLLILILAGILIIGGSALGYFYYSKNNAVTLSPTPTEMPTPTMTPSTTQPVPTPTQSPNPKTVSDVVADNLRVARAKSIQTGFKQDINNNMIAQATGENVPDWQYPSTLGNSTSVSDPVTGKSFEYKVDSDGKDYILCITLSVKGEICGKSDMNWSLYITK